MNDESIAMCYHVLHYAVSRTTACIIEVKFIIYHSFPPKRDRLFIICMLRSNLRCSVEKVMEVTAFQFLLKEKG